MLTGWTFSGVSQVSLPKTPTGIYLYRGRDREKEVIEERSRLDSRSPFSGREVIAQFVKKLE